MANSQPTTRRTTICVFAALAVLLVLPVVGQIRDGQKESGQKRNGKLDYETHIRPIFRSHCFKCHSDKVSKGGLDLSTPVAVVRGGESGRVVTAGKPAESYLLELLEDRTMPPKDSGVKPLSAGQLQLIRTWISDGARFRSKVASRPAVTQHDIIPLMLLRCTACHGARRKEAGLDLRTKASMLKGGKSGPAIVPGKPEQSLVVKRIESGQMPPARLLVSVSVKTMSSSELARVKQWIAAGLPESPLGPDVATRDPDKLVTDKDRQFWSFRPPRSVSPPPVRNRARVHNEIDRFVLAKLEAKGLDLAPEADRATLIRRVTFDLLGLPPTPEEVEAFVRDPNPRAYHRLVERLLASPRHGERWARYWLDAAGYADSEGAQNEDRVRKNMWRYRDYVVRSMNADKSYRRFLHEQIAGDELAQYESGQVIDGRLYDNLAATGFLRTAPDRTFANITNFVPERLEVIADEMQIFGSAVLGLTIHCARCHSHKFDPIPQRDYYRLTAVFKDGYDEHDWLKSQGPRTLHFVRHDERQAWLQQKRSIDQQVALLRKQLAGEKDAARKKGIEAQIKQAESRRRPEPRIRALWSRGTPSPTYILKRGNYLTPGREVGPGVPSVLTDGRTPFRFGPPWKGAKKTGRRLALARWLTRPDNPLTARVMVNRIWKHHLGRGIVRTLGNFGLMGARPTHPQLLDWLAVEFVRRDWSMKSIHRLIVTSSTYRQQSQVTAMHLKLDPDNDLFSRMPMRRLEAEEVRDSLLAVAGQLDETQFGPADPLEVRADGLVTARKVHGSWRRSVFVLQRRTRTPTLLESFDFPQMGPNCLERSESIVAPQALHLLNNATVHEWAGHLAERVRREVGADTRARVTRIHQLALGRRPTAEQMEIALRMLHETTEKWKLALPASNQRDTTARRRALANYCHAILNSAAFVYVD